MKSLIPKIWNTKDILIQIGCLAMYSLHRRWHSWVYRIWSACGSLLGWKTPAEWLFQSISWEWLGLVKWHTLIPGLVMAPGLVWGMNLKCPWITFGVKNPCGMTFPEHLLGLVKLHIPVGGLAMTPGIVWGMNPKCPLITFGAKNPCGITSPEHPPRVAGPGQMTHPNSVNSTQPSSMMSGYGQASNFGLKSTYWKGFSEFSGIGSQYSQNIYSALLFTFTSNKQTIYIAINLWMVHYKVSYNFLDISSENHVI